MDNEKLSVNPSLPIHLWYLKELSKERVINTPFIRSKRGDSIIFSEKLKKPCSKIFSKW